ncbi:MAG: YggT family protein [Clostridiales Family XIII bacterium]|jgi:uncharacterized protein YggT (Ycf19 family)|nr:YggT family protein [Clostridiales Family XIII bacterium]
MYIIFVNLITSIFIWALVIQAVLSWFANPYGRGSYGLISTIYRGLSSFTYPLTYPARLILSKINTGPMDFSLLLTMLFIYALRRILLLLA